MLPNNTYNLAAQMVEECQSLWRIQKSYKADAQQEGCSQCIAFWEKLEKDKGEHIKELQELVKDHIAVKEHV